MSEGPVGWTARTRVLHGRFGPTRLGRRVPSRSRAPHHRNNGHRRTIGQNVSSGCIRLTNDDIIDLYNRTPIGTKAYAQKLGRPAATPE
jgi:hypothetical protein